MGRNLLEMMAIIAAVQGRVGNRAENSTGGREEQSVGSGPQQLIDMGGA